MDVLPREWLQGHRHRLKDQQVLEQRAEQQEAAKMKALFEDPAKLMLLEGYVGRIGGLLGRKLARLAMEASMEVPPLSRDDAAKWARLAKAKKNIPLLRQAMEQAETGLPVPKEVAGELAVCILGQMQGMSSPSGKTPSLTLTRCCP